MSVWIYFFLLLFLIQAVYYCFFFVNFPRKDSKPASATKNSVSLIIAYKNELENLKNLLPQLLQQEHPNFEIILVNDHSTDGGNHWLESQEDERISCVDLIKGSGKKAAIRSGIEHAKMPILLFTDADCLPMSNHWIEQMASRLSQGTEICLGYSGFYKKGSLLNRLQRYENFMNTLQNFSFANTSKAYMAVGRNLCYTKDIYCRSKAFDAHADIRSGDDDLLVNEMSNKQNTLTLISDASKTISKAKESWKQFFIQKRRHLEAGRRYQLSDQLKLAIWGSAQLLFNILFIVLLLFSAELSIILSIFVGKVILQLIAYWNPLKKLDELDLFFFIPFLELVYLPIISFVGLSQYLWKVDRWK